MQKTVAVLTIYRAAEMTAKGRKEVAGWLTRQRHLVLRHPGELAGRYRARYLVATEVKGEAHGAEVVG